MAGVHYFGGCLGFGFQGVGFRHSGAGGVQCFRPLRFLLHGFSPEAK